MFPFPSVGLFSTTSWGSDRCCPSTRVVVWTFSFPTLHSSLRSLWSLTLSRYTILGTGDDSVSGGRPSCGSLFVGLEWKGERKVGTNTEGNRCWSPELQQVSPVIEFRVSSYPILPVMLVPLFTFHVTSSFPFGLDMEVDKRKNINTQNRMTWYLRSFRRCHEMSQTPVYEDHSGVSYRLSSVPCLGRGGDQSCLEPRKCYTETTSLLCVSCVETRTETVSWSLSVYSDRERCNFCPC